MSNPVKLNENPGAAVEITRSTQLKIAKQPNVIRTHGFTSFVNTRDILDIEPLIITSDDQSFEKIENCLDKKDTQKVKLKLRKYNLLLSSPIRSILWPKLCAQHATQDNSISSESYEELVQKVIGKMSNVLSKDPNEPSSSNQVPVPWFINSSQYMHYHLNPEGVKSVNRILTILAHEHSGITFSMELQPLTALIVHYVSEAEAYNCIEILIKNTDTMFVNQTKEQHAMTSFAVFQMIKKYDRPVIELFSKLCLNCNLEEIFGNWNLWLFAGLPFPHLVRIMDCFLHEGIKVLYRVTIVTLNLFSKKWQTVNGITKELMKNDINSAVIEFNKNLNITPAELLTSSFNIRNFSSNYIAKQYKVANNQVKASTNAKNVKEPGPSQSVILRDEVQRQTWQKMLFRLWTWMPVRIPATPPMPLLSAQTQSESFDELYPDITNCVLMIETYSNETIKLKSSTSESNYENTDRRFWAIYTGYNNERFIDSLYPKKRRYFIRLNLHRFKSSISKEHVIWLNEMLSYGRTENDESFNNSSLLLPNKLKINLLKIFILSENQSKSIENI